MEDDINVTINNLYLYVPKLLPSVETQARFNEATQNNHTISFDEWYTERRVISDTITQLDNSTSQHVISPKILIAATQNNHKISFDEWYTERRVISDTITQLDNSTSQHVISPKILIAATQNNHKISFDERYTER